MTNRKQILSSRKKLLDGGYSIWTRTTNSQSNSPYSILFRRTSCIEYNSLSHMIAVVPSTSHGKLKLFSKISNTNNFAVQFNLLGWQIAWKLPAEYDFHCSGWLNLFWRWLWIWGANYRLWIIVNFPMYFSPLKQQIQHLWSALFVCQTNTDRFYRFF